MKTQKYNRESLRGTWYVEAAGLVLLLTAANCFGQLFRVLEPNGGQSYFIGDKMTIRWSGGNPSVPVTILLSYNSGTSWPKTVVASTSNDGSYEWAAIDADPSTRCRIAVGTSLANADRSDADFTIKWGPVHFNDPNLKRAVEHSLGVNDPTPFDMLGLTELDVMDHGISDLTGLEYAVNLERLTISENSVSDLSPLAGLTKLQELAAAFCQITDLYPLAGLTKLQGLLLQNNQISDVCALTGLTNLYLVNLHNNCLMHEACDTCIPQIKANNPNASILHDSCNWVSVPNVLGMTRSQARSAIQAGGLELGTVGSAASKAPAGTVISQNPSAGAVAYADSQVEITLSSGPVQVAVPSLLGQTQAQAEATLQAVGLALGTVGSAASTAPAGTVISQNPSVGTMVNGGSTVAITLSSGPAQVAVPNLLGKTQAQAQAALQAAGLVLGTVGLATSSNPPGTVIGQNPSAGSVINGGSAVDITLSSGPEQGQVAVPNLLGMTQTQAEAVLQAAGLIVGPLSWAPSDRPQETVIEQNPTAGTPVNVGSAVAVTLSIPPIIERVVHYVDADAQGENNGSSWKDAFVYLQDALSPVRAVDEIWVAEGSYRPDLGVGYTPGDRLASFRLKNGVTLKGGFAGFGKPDPDARDIARYETVLSGNIGDPASNADNSLHVVMAVNCDASTVLEGLTIADGNANGANNPDNRGAGLFNNPASLKVIDCTFRNNAASWFGAGLYNNYNSKSEPNLIHCTFRNNTAGSNGAAVYSHSTCNPTFTDCLFQGNTAATGGGAAVQVFQSSATLTDCNFIDNQAKSGAAVYGAQDTTTVVNCTFSGNSATDNGGAVKSDKGTMTLTDCTFTENSATRGGAMHCSNSSQSKLTGCVFVGNTAGTEGGAIVNDTAETAIAGCTFLDNVAGTNGGGLLLDKSDAWVVNCTFAGNSAKLAGGVSSQMSESRLVGCVFTGNAATTDGGGLVITNCPKPASVVNCTFSRNNATNRGGGIYDANSVATVSNSILWGNTAAQGAQLALASAATMTVQRCDVQDGQAKVYAVASTLTWGVGNITSDPKFTDADGPDNKIGTEDDQLDLLAGSPCIDAGDDKQVPADAADVDGDGNVTERLPLDIAGRPRFVDDPTTANTGVADPPTHPGIVDIGAYERGS